MRGLSPDPWAIPMGEGRRTRRQSHCLFFPQMELKSGKGPGERAGPDWKAALQREREEQQHLLAESYSAVMELTRQLQISEHNWSQEKLQLVERLQGEKQQVEQQVKELQNRLSQVRPAAALPSQSCKGLAGSRCDNKFSGRRSFRPRWIWMLREAQVSPNLSFSPSLNCLQTLPVSFVLLPEQCGNCHGKSFSFPPTLARWFVYQGTHQEEARVDSL